MEELTRELLDKLAASVQKLEDGQKEILLAQVSHKAVHDITDARAKLVYGFLYEGNGSSGKSQIAANSEFRKWSIGVMTTLVVSLILQGIQLYRLVTGMLVPH